MPDNRAQRQIVRMIGGMAVGFLVVTALVLSGALEAVATWRPEEIVSTGLAVLLLMMSAIVWVGTSSRRSFAMLNEEGHEHPAEPETLTMLRRQAVVSGLMGLMLILPPAAAHAGLTGATAVLPVVVLVALIVWQSWLYLRLNRDGDELNRAVATESGSASFMVCGLALFGWASLEKLALLPALDSWTMVIAMLVLSLIASTWVSVRRGLIGR